MNTIDNRTSRATLNHVAPTRDSAPKITEEQVKRAMARVEYFQLMDIGDGRSVGVTGMRLDDAGIVRLSMDPSTPDKAAAAEVARAMLIAEGVSDPVLALENVRPEGAPLVKLPPAFMKTDGQVDRMQTRADRTALRMLGLDENIKPHPRPAATDTSQADRIAARMLGLDEDNASQTPSTSQQTMPTARTSPLSLLIREKEKAK